MRFFAALILLGLAASFSLHAADAIVEQSTKDWSGKAAPTFTLEDPDGKSVDISKEVGKRPVVLVFYRGIW